MSGINSLIDTVLHQVLGKRVDTAPPRELNEPVRPVSPSDAPRALHSDSRLDARASAPQVAESLRSGREASGSAFSPRSGGEAPPPSTQTHFTPAARTIADVLLRFPAPASALRPPAPLLAAGESPTPGLVAERLQGSLRDSGLFYESHLARWYRGEMPREQLLREPQGLRLQPPLPPSPPSGPQASGPGSPHPAGQEAPRLSQPAYTPASPALERELMSPLRRAPTSAVEPPERNVSLPAREAPSPAVREPIPESLQGIVRQQLEMLVTPVLRWEGDVWTGLFMALVLQVPLAQREESSAGGERQGGDEQESWRSDMTLEVADFGEVRVSLWMQGKRLGIGLSAPEPRVREALEGGLGRLESRLAALGLEAVSVQLHQEPRHE
ncbi:flagellar hook-length control protein FliK [Halomonas mongoliensis]|uniref:Flagellar hook-length control protein FliK n=1 Tax=Halomonas mongoliensis TaxID=321265 RepID=A0ABU1GMS4_9GAMM|nr:flagellar hook-length control protein FliK [Halomonas mongoliensis]MDR5893326.1 flagellar hook-length control protein FliK [Halomonas mongoliensis]